MKNRQTTSRSIFKKVSNRELLTKLFFTFSKTKIPFYWLDNFFLQKKAVTPNRATAFFSLSNHV
jgi:hypothetical protein